MQWPVNREIIRYTLLTGESIYQGFTRIHALLGWIFWLIALFGIIVGFGGYASAAGTGLAYLTNFPFGWSPRGQTLFWAYVMIFICVIVFMLGSVAYRVLEVVEAIASVIAILGLLFACMLHPAVSAIVSEFFTNLVTLRPITPPNFDLGDTRILLTLVAFSGMGGWYNLLYSYWVRDKGAAMSKYIGRVTSPITGTFETVPEVGYSFEPTARNLKEWKKWDRWAIFDNSYGVICNTIAIMLTSILSFAILYPKGLWPKGWELVSVQAKWFSAVWGPIGATILLLIAAIFFGDTYFVIVDGVSRWNSDWFWFNFESVRKRTFRWWYYLFLAIFSILACSLIQVAMPGILITAGGVIMALFMAIYNPFIMFLNWYIVPRIHKSGKAVRPGIVDTVLMSISIVFYLWYAVLWISLQL
jgi:hypothetical protein